VTGAIYFTLAKFKDPIKNLKVGVPAVVVFLLVVLWTGSPYTTAGALAVVGFFSYLTMASVTQSLHLSTPDQFRGRLGSLISLGCLTVGPLMSFPIGIYTDWAGFAAAILHTTLLYGALSAGLAALHRREIVTRRL